uniref:Uncharacterized protein n=1 Tax=Magnetococcus massalia (strain MO-1) TaxID=451514 RepID=A0A1S7LDH0_MAGMO|nr:conserved protein of unknown function [Candidatus Magnetococcus massalia]
MKVTPNAKNISSKPAIVPTAVQKQLDVLKRQSQGLSALLQLERQSRKAQNIKELLFIMVNDTKRVLPYRQGLVWQNRSKKSVRISAASGVSTVDRNAPFIIWLTKVLGEIQPMVAETKPKARIIKMEDLPEKQREGWEKWSSGHSMVCPLVDTYGTITGGLFLSRDTPWRDEEVEILSMLMEGYSYVVTNLAHSKPSTWTKIVKIIFPRSLFKLAMVGAIAGSMFLPIRLSVLAPAEVVPFQPLVISSPLDGVVDTIHVKPNQKIAAGDVLFSLDDTTIRNQYEVARQAMEVAKAEYGTAAQQAFWDTESKSRLEWLQAQVEKKREEMEYNLELLRRVKIRAERPGIAVFTDVNDWLGKPVKVGEKVMVVANPAQVTVKSWVAVADAINMQPGAEVLFFLNIDPINPRPAKLYQASYEASMSPDSILAYSAKSVFAKGTEPPRIGLKGTAKIHGEEVSLFYYLFRRPMAYMRQTFGL